MNNELQWQIKSEIIVVACFSTIIIIIRVCTWFKCRYVNNNNNNSYIPSILLCIRHIVSDAWLVDTLIIIIMVFLLNYILVMHFCALFFLFPSFLLLLHSSLLFIFFFFGYSSFASTFGMQVSDIKAAHSMRWMGGWAIYAINMCIIKIRTIFLKQNFRYRSKPFFYIAHAVRGIYSLFEPEKKTCNE